MVSGGIKAVIAAIAYLVDGVWRDLYRTAVLPCVIRSAGTVKMPSEQKICAKLEFAP
ncbi:hypothetical protein KCP69_17475 [Salmonella enterica subsp. enterica]|nr:hypothetical protein KCP69_17475 [Salmonella enterica subsp. enterica]